MFLWIFIFCSWFVCLFLLFLLLVFCCVVVFSFGFCYRFFFYQSNNQAFRWSRPIGHATAVCCTSSTATIPKVGTYWRLKENGKKNWGKRCFLFCFFFLTSLSVNHDGFMMIVCRNLRHGSEKAWYAAEKRGKVRNDEEKYSPFLALLLASFVKVQESHGAISCFFFFSFPLSLRSLASFGHAYVNLLVQFLSLFFPFLTAR